MTEEKNKKLEDRVSSLEDKLEILDSAIIYVSVEVDEIIEVLLDTIRGNDALRKARIYGWLDKGTKPTKIEQTPIPDELDL